MRSDLSKYTPSICCLLGGASQVTHLPMKLSQFLRLCSKYNTHRSKINRVWCICHFFNMLNEYIRMKDNVISFVLSAQIHAVIGWVWWRVKWGRVLISFSISPCHFKGEWSDSVCSHPCYLLCGDYMTAGFSLHVLVCAFWKGMNTESQIRQATVCVGKFNCVTCWQKHVTRQRTGSSGPMDLTYWMHFYRHELWVLQFWQCWTCALNSKLVK